MKIVRDTYTVSILQKPKQTQKVVPKKCTLCEIILNVPCLNPVCAGHQNESRGDLCEYCATNQRYEPLYLPESQALVFSSLRALQDNVREEIDTDIDWDEL